QQSGRVRWIGVLHPVLDNDPDYRERVAVLEQSLDKLGWTVGRNLSIDYRWAANDSEKARAAVAQIMRLPLDVIVANGGPPLTAAQEATRTIPIVFVGVSEPVERGFVASLAKPGGNTTGFTNLEATIGGKWLELLKEIAPRVNDVTAVFNPASSFAISFFQSAATAAQKLAVKIVAAHVHDAAGISAAISALAREQGVGLMLPPDGFTGAYRQQILELAARYRLPTISASKAYVADGSLMSYGQEFLDMYRRAATYVDRILRGE